MSDPAAGPLKRTPLYDLHRELGARLVPFAGYEMPVQYPTGILAEHTQTRTSCGLFDVSHMGQVRLDGPGAAAALETLVPVDVLGLGVNRQRYAVFTNEAGGLLDDLMIVNAGDHLFLVVNAACKAQDLAHLRAHLEPAVRVTELADRALLALPKGDRILTKGGLGVDTVTPLVLRGVTTRAVCSGASAASANGAASNNPAKTIPKT